MARIYGPSAETLREQAERYARLLDLFAGRFPDAADNLGLFSAPGRVEIGGNHTDHNHGRILAAAVDLDTIAVAAPTDETIVTVHSDGYDRPFTVDLADLSPQSSERHTTNALIRGVAAHLVETGQRVGGFQACLASAIPVGSGLSSSAACEVLTGAIFNHFFSNGRLEPRQIALAGQHAENFYFGKPSGLMDQMTSTLGGFVTIDFAHPRDPKVRSVEFDLSGGGFVLVVTNTGVSHANLTNEYGAVQREMEAVAQALGGSVLRDISEDNLLAHIPEIRSRVGDRAILRALHFFADNRRVAEQVASLEIGDTGRFLALVRESGRSSWMLLQNCHAGGSIEQGLCLALALSELVLRGSGAWRVHGGGFGGTILAIVPTDLVDEYIRRMEDVFGPEAARALHVRPTGATRIKI